MPFDAARYRAVSFDCYGTLIDWETGLAAVLGSWLARRDPFVGCMDLLAAFAEAQHRRQQARPAAGYRDLVREALRDAILERGLAPDRPLLDRAVESIGLWPPFPDSVDALRALKSRGLYIAVLSNVDTRSFAATAEMLGGLVDTVVTAEEVGAYKPAPEMFEALLASLSRRGIDRAELLHAAQSRFHDVAPASALGLDVVWIDRRAGRPGRGITVPSEARPLVRLGSLAELAELMARAD